MDLSDSDEEDDPDFQPQEPDTVDAADPFGSDDVQMDAQELADLRTEEAAYQAQEFQPEEPNTSLADLEEDLGHDIDDGTVQMDTEVSGLQGEEREFQAKHLSHDENGVAHLGPQDEGHDRDQDADAEDNGEEDTLTYLKAAADRGSPMPRRVTFRTTSLRSQDFNISVTGLGATNDAVCLL